MKLVQGDKIGIIALAGVCEGKKSKNNESDKLTEAKKTFEELGFRVEFSKNIYDENDYLAGSDEDKISELHRFFKDSEIKLILNARGGYGSIRLLDKIDYDIIKNNPKPFCGYSDITALLLMIYKNTGLETYHSPMALSGFEEEEQKKYNYENFLTALSGKKYTIDGSKIYKSGKAEGIIWGGNLSTVVSLCGLDFIPNKDFIFFAEDLNEPVYKIDKMFQQLFNIQLFRKNCKGIVLGDFLKPDSEELLERYFSAFAEKYLIPMYGGFRITHLPNKVTIPIGRKATLDNGMLVIHSS